MNYSLNTDISNQSLSRVLNILDSSLNIEELNTITITDISDDSRTIENGGLFIARQGSVDHGDRFIHDAIQNGAVAVLHQVIDRVSSNEKNSYVEWHKQKTHKVNTLIPEIYIEFGDKDIGKIAAKFYNNPSQNISITGITGTNGKTSCAFFLAHMISKKQKCGIIGTIGFGELTALKPSINTTPGVIENQKIIANMLSKGIKHIVMEVSSHAIAQNRIAEINIETAVFTNLTQDHLDFHLTFKNYANTKLQLFKSDKLKYAVINLDDPFCTEIQNVLSNNVKIISYAINNSSADIYANICNVNLKGTELKIRYQDYEIDVKLALIGDFNISNILAACAVLLSQGQTLKQIQELLQDLPVVKGRMQSLGGVNGLPLVVVDFAHSPDALSKVLKTLRKYSENNLICVFGCGGERDKSKRPLMGEIASRLADIVIITNDNPRSENPQDIVKAIFSGVSINNKNKIKIELDRALAIQHVINIASEHDVILIAGKGHEQYQLIGESKNYFDDVEISLNILKKTGLK